MATAATNAMGAAWDADIWLYELGANQPDVALWLCRLFASVNHMNNYAENALVAAAARQRKMLQLLKTKMRHSTPV
eukprot:7929725-Lingulodinium_polyedra.AAC.1